jgi:glutamate synthase domain-containing protein 1
MCGIIGFLNKTTNRRQPLGATLLNMLRALGCRGPDSAGVAIFSEPSDCYVLQIKLPEQGDVAASARQVVDAAARHAGVKAEMVTGPYLRLAVQNLTDWNRLSESVEAAVPGTEVISLGRQLEILKQVGSPDALDATYGIARLTGTHGIGHTRLSTESKVDLSHSQPFWAHGVPDLATVHNGHITNYHKLRRRYEQKGYRFYTENDSEVIGMYLRDRMAAGMPLADALRSSLDDFDGSFSYLAANGNTLAYVRDRFGFKPLIVAETDDFMAIATEEIALRRTLGSDFDAREPAPGTMRVWSVKSLIATPAVT